MPHDDENQIPSSVESAPVTEEEQTPHQDPVEETHSNEGEGEDAAPAVKRKTQHRLKDEDQLPPEGIDMQASPFTHLDADAPPKLKSWPIPAAMSPTTPEEVGEMLEAYRIEASKRLSPEHVNEAVANYSSFLNTTYMGHWRGGIYDDIFRREGGAFSQAIDSERGPIRIATQKVGTVASNTLSGPAAVIALQNAMGLGRPTRVPLWASGVVVTLANFKESEILSLNMALTETRTELGYETNGVYFSGGDVNITTEIVDFVLAHVISTNIRGWTKGDIETLKQAILVMDIPCLLAGALSSIYPSGYPVVHGCKHSGTETCNYTPEIKQDIDGYEFAVDSLLDFKKVIFTDKSRINTAQRRHMAAKDGTYTLDQIREYQDGFNALDPISGPIGEEGCEMRIAFRQPSIAQYEEMGRLWIHRVMEMVNEVMDRVTTGSRDTRRQKRRTIMQSYRQALRLQRHAAWIESLQYTLPGEEDPIIVEDRDTIFSSLETLVDDKDMANAFTDAVNQYRVDSQVSFAGVPNYRCPSCGTPQEDPETLKHSLLPIDLVAYFFTITVWRWGRGAITSTQQS